MERNEVVVDTCFLQKLSGEGKNPDNIKKVFDELGFAPIVHPYIYKHEMSLYSYMDKLIVSGYIRKVNYCEFINKSGKQYYKEVFIWLYRELQSYLKAKNAPKQMKDLAISSEQNIFDVHVQGSNMGDIHMIIMATFMQLPVILTEDSDIKILQIMVKKRIAFGEYTLTIYNGWDLIKKIAENPKTGMTKRELEQILNDMRERERRAEMKAIYNENH